MEQSAADVDLDTDDPAFENTTAHLPKEPTIFDTGLALGE